MTTLTTPLTTTHLAILVVAIVIVGALITLYALPGYFADLRKWNEPVEPMDIDADRQLRAALARRTTPEETP